LSQRATPWVSSFVSSPSAFAATSATSTPREQARKAAQGSRQAGAVVEASRRARMAAGLRMAPRRKLIATCRSATPQTPRWAAAPLCPGRHPAFAVEVVPAELRREGKVRSESKTDYRGVGRQGGIPCSCVTRAAPSVPLTASSSVRRMGVGEDTRSGQAETVTFYSLPGPGLNIILYWKETYAALQVLPCPAPARPDTDIGVTDSIKSVKSQETTQFRNAEA
jgi:hypothetical protein